MEDEPDSQTEQQKMEIYRKILEDLMSGVAVKTNLEAWEQEIEFNDFNAIRGWLSTFIVSQDWTTDNKPQTVWQLIESIVGVRQPNNATPLAAEQAKLDKAKEVLSNPLNGQPSEILAESGIAQQGHPLAKIELAVRTELNPSQAKAWSQLTGF